MRRLVLFIEIAFIVLIASILYRRYIKPIRDAMSSARNGVGQRPSTGRPVDEQPKPGTINSNPHRPIDRSNVRDAEFEDLS